MPLLIASYLAGMLTILSPCVLPVLPFVFARAGRPFVSSVLPMLVGLVLTFALVAALAAVGGGWAVQANEIGRNVALAVMAVFGLTLLWPPLAERLTRPLVAMGARLSERIGNKPAGSVSASLLLGVATGLLWTPCAGPVLGLLLAGAALNGPAVGTTLLFLAYAAGAATSLALALLAGGRVFAFMKRGLGVGEGIRRGLGVAVLAGVAAIAFGLDTAYLARVPSAGAATIEEGLVRGLAQRTPPTPGSDAAKPVPADLPVEGRAPALNGVTAWLNSEPLTAFPKGKVTLVDFWTYSCINCLRAMPYVHAWAERYKDAGLVVIGVHTPEFAFEKNIENVRRAARSLGVTHPIALDNDFAVWRAFDNHYWPAHYLIDAEGRIRFHHFGEGEYERTEAAIRALLVEAGGRVAEAGATKVEAEGVQAPAVFAEVRSPETYVGYDRAENFRSTAPMVRDASASYEAPASLRLNQWAVSGPWIFESERAVAQAGGTRLLFRFRARDLHLVLGPGPDGTPIRFRVRLDGETPGTDHGADTDASGIGVIGEQRLYQLIRQSSGVRERTFEIEFLDPGAQAFAFTFG